jgi:NAD(P)-dependent dehydrogenase (short-subunit alcohol dehydrogenase family)
MTTSPLILVTGATGNVGCAVIAELEARGNRVLRVERTAIRDGREHVCDIALDRDEAVQRAFSRVVERYGAIDGVVHTVGVYRGGARLLDATLDDFAALFATNTMTTVHVLRAALAHMLPRRNGRIAVVVSAGALSGSTGAAAYSASKAAQLRVIESAADELDEDAGITLNAVLPGTLDTPENRTANPNADPARWVRVERVAKLLAELVSPHGPALHGQILKLGTT